MSWRWIAGRTALVGGVSGRTIDRMPAQTWVTPVTLTGRRVRMEPLADAHLADLERVALDAEIWRWITAKPMDADGLRAWFDLARANADAGVEVPFATIDATTGRAIGSTRFSAETAVRTRNPPR